MWCMCYVGMSVLWLCGQRQARAAEREAETRIQQFASDKHQAAGLVVAMLGRRKYSGAYQRATCLASTRCD